MSRQHSHRTLPLTLAIVLILVLLIAACGAAATPTAVPVPPTATKAAAAAPTATTAATAPTATTAAAAPTATKAAAAAPTATTAATTGGSAATVSFAKSVLPIFQQNCVRCHGGGNPRSGLSLESYQGAMKGGSQGVDVVAGSPDKSNVCQFVTNGVMPFGGPKLASSDVQTICNWIQQGAQNN